MSELHKPKPSIEVERWPTNVFFNDSTAAAIYGFWRDVQYHAPKHWAPKVRTSADSVPLAVDFGRRGVDVVAVFIDESHLLRRLDDFDAKMIAANPTYTAHGSGGRVYSMGAAVEVPHEGRDWTAEHPRPKSGANWGA